MSGRAAVTEASLDDRGGLREAVARRVAFCRSAFRGGVNYARNVTRLMARGLEGRALRAAAAVAAGQLSLAAQAGALGILYWYAEQAQADAVVSVGPLGLEWRARELWLLGAVIGASGLCFLGSAGFLHRSERLILGIGQEELARRLTQVVRVARRLPDPRAADASRIFIESGLGRVNHGCRDGAMATVRILSAVTPVIGGVAAGVALVVIDPLLTGMLIVGAGLWCLLLYPLMMRQAAIPARLARAQQALAEESRALLRSPPATRTPETMKSAAELARVRIGGRRVMDDITLVLQSGTAVFGTLAALYLAATILGGDEDWPKFILYLGGLRIALNGGFAAPQVFGIVSRLYPRFLLSIRFLQSASGLDELSLGRLCAGESVLLGRLPDGAEVLARGGDRMALAALAVPAAVQAVFLQARAVDTGQRVAAAWMRPDAPFDSVRADASIQLIDAGALAALEPVAVQAVFDRVPPGVIVIVHRDAARIGAFGESRLLAAEEGVLSEHVRLGTAESYAVLESFADRAQAAAAKQDRAMSSGPAGMDDHEDEDQ